MMEWRVLLACTLGVVLKYSECLCNCGAGVMFVWACFAAGGGVCSSFAPMVLAGACCADLPADVAPRESTVERG